MEELQSFMSALSSKPAFPVAYLQAGLFILLLCALVNLIASIVGHLSVHHLISFEAEAQCRTQIMHTPSRFSAVIADEVCMQ